MAAIIFDAGAPWSREFSAEVAHFNTLTPPVASPSLALVNKVVQHLRDQAFLESLPSRGFRFAITRGYCKFGVKPIGSIVLNAVAILRFCKAVPLTTRCVRWTRVPTAVLRMQLSPLPTSKRLTFDKRAPGCI